MRPLTPNHPPSKQSDATEGKPSTPITGRGKDLLSNAIIRLTLKHPLFVPLVQLPNVLIFALVIATGLWGVQQGGSNFATFVTWVIWWPLIIFTFIGVGRLWCLACPLVAVGEWSHRGVMWGKRKTNWSLDKKWPRWLRNLWLPTVLLLAVTWVDHQFTITSSPLHTAYFVIFVLTLSVLIGLIFERRAFCRYVCPIGGMIGLYSMLAPVGLRTKDASVCRDHLGKDCIRGNESGYGCPMFEFPQTLDRNNYCNYCMECLKTCPKNNIAIKPQHFFKDLVETKVRRLDEAVLAVVLVGITTFQTLVMVKPWEGTLEQASRVLGVSNSLTFILLYGLISLVVPLVLYSGAVLTTKFLSREKPVPSRNLFIVFAYVFMPIGLAMHLTHNVSHLVNEGSKVLSIVSDPFGYGWNLLGISKYTPIPLLPGSVLNVTQIALIVLGQAAAAYLGYKLSTHLFRDANKAEKVIIPMLTLAAIFSLANIWVLGLPMAHRD